MLIVSKFHDYYDGAMIYGQDKDCVYTRNTTEVETKYYNTLPYSADYLMAGGARLDVNPILIGFCGKFYPVLELKYTPSTHPFYAPHTPKDDYIYDAQTYLDFLEYQGKCLRNSKYFTWGRGSLNDKKGIEAFFSQKYSVLDPIFRELHTPIFAIRKKMLINNPSLQKLMFFRMIDPPSAFQEIYQYLGGVLGNKEKEIITISDKDKAKQHGHDGKYSFKTPKVKK